MMTTSAKSLAQWLDELVDANPDDRRGISIAGLDDGIALAKVYCERHKQQLNWLSAFSHLDRTEATHRLQNGEGTRLHQPGELRPYRPGERRGAPPSPWTVAVCGRPGCKGWIVWAVLETGRRLPVDAEPVADGAFVLVAQPGEPDPLAMRLFGDDPHIGDSERHAPHQRTCRAGRSTTTRTGGRR